MLEIDEILLYSSDHFREFQYFYQYYFGKKL